MNIAFWKSGKIRSFEVNKDAVKKATLTSRFFASKTLGLDLDPMEARSRYGMRDEQEKTFMLQKGPLGEDRLEAGIAHQIDILVMDVSLRVFVVKNILLHNHKVCLQT